MRANSHLAEAALYYLNESAPVAGLVLDTQWRVTTANAHARRIWGAEVEGRLFAELVLDFSPGLDLAASMVRSEVHHRLTLQVPAPSPRRYQFQFFALPEGVLALGSTDLEELAELRGPGHEVGGEQSQVTRQVPWAGIELEARVEARTQQLQSMIQSLEQKIADCGRVERELLEAQEELRAIHDHSPLMICLLDKDRRITRANRALVEFVGKPLQEIEGQPACGFLGCVNALEDVKGCGFGSACETCSLWRAMRETLQTGQPCGEVERQLRIKRGGEEREIVLRGFTALLSSGRDSKLLLFLEDVTQRIHAERSLRESEARLRQATLGSNTGLWDWDLATNQVHYSPIWKRQIGYEEHEISDRLEEWQSRVHPDDLKRVQAAVQSFLANPGPHYESEFRFRHKNGAYRWILAKGCLVTDEAGQPRRMLGSHLDITERKEVEKALQLSQANLLALLSNTEDIVASRDLEGRLIVFNQAFARNTKRLFGVEAAPGLRTINLLPPAQREYWESVLRSVMKGYPHREEFSYDFGGGEVRYYEISFHPIQSDGQVIGTTEFTRDTTERNRREEQLRESEERFRWTFDQCPVGAAIVSMDYRFMRVNDSLCRLTGFTRQELTGLRFSDLAHPDDRMADLALIWQLERGEIDRYQINKRYRRKDDKIIWIHLSVRMMRNGCGQPVYFLPVMEDITELREAESALRASESRYRTVAEELHQNREEIRRLALRSEEAEENERKRMARELHDQVGQCLIALSLNLDFIRHSLSRAEDDPVQIRLKDSLAMLEQATTAIRNLMTDLRPTVLDDYGLEAALRSYASQFTSRSGIPLEITAAPGWRRFHPQLENILFRIAQEALNNVVKHAKAASVWIWLHADLDKVQMEITDDGVGFVVPAAARPGRPQWGLLNMKERALGIQGSFKVESAPGRGTTVLVELPL